jgi:bacterial/archaeal transporter family-2 protein
MQNLYVVLAIIAGAGLAAQVVVNAELRATTQSPLWAAVISFFVGLTGLALVTALWREPLATAGWPRAPWWTWTGGLLGAVYILLAAALARQLGAALLLALVIAGQVITSVVIDHYGWLGAPIHRLSIPRIVGAVLLVVGVALIRWR